MAPHLRRGEVIAGLGGLVALVALFVLPWFAGSGSGWTALPILRWPIAVAALSGLALAILQATRRAPALPVATSLVATPLAALTTLALIIRIPTDAASPRPGAFVGLVAVAAVTAGAFWSLRAEDGWTPDPEHPIERISLRTPEGGAHT